MTPTEARLEAGYAQLGRLLTGSLVRGARFDFTVQGVTGVCRRQAGSTVAIEIPLLGSVDRQLARWPFTVRRPTGLEAWWLAIGGRRSVASGDPTFDREIAFSAPSRARSFLARWIGDPEVRRQLLAILALRPGVTLTVGEPRPRGEPPLPDGRSVLVATFSVGAGSREVPIDAIPGWIAALVQLGRTIPSGRWHRPDLGPLGVLILATFFGIFLGPLLSWAVQGELLGGKELVAPGSPLSWPLAAWSAAIDLLFAGLVLLAAARRHGLIALALGLPLALLHLIPVYSYLSVLNSGLDFAEPSTLEVRVESSRTITDARGRSTGSCRVILSELTTPPHRFQISGLCKNLPEAGPARITVGRGLLGVAYVRRFEAR